MSAETRPVLITAGGTGGHVYPALAVARELQARQVPVVWMGTRRGLEARVVPGAGIPMAWLWVSGLRGKGLLAWLLAPLRVMIALSQALVIVLRYRPRAVLGMGGFVSGPGGLIAALLRRPLVIHEQNAVAGLTNRILSRFSRRVLEGFPGTFEDIADVVYTGNPVRADIAAIEAPETRLAGRSGPLRLLVIGGSQGAQVLNETLPDVLKCLPEHRRPEVWHQAGSRNIESAERRYRLAQVKVRVAPFIEDMAEAYAWADLVLCRSGALTVAELAAAGVGSILVPFPFAVDDHQTRNGAFLADAGAAVLLPQSQLSPSRLTELLERLGNDRQCLLEMAVAARRLARVGATQQVADICLAVAGGDNGAQIASPAKGGKL